MKGFQVWSHVPQAEERLHDIQIDQRYRLLSFQPAAQIYTDFTFSGTGGSSNDHDPGEIEPVQESLRRLAIIVLIAIE